MTMSAFGTMTNTRTACIVTSVVIFVFILFIIPYNLSQISKQNSVNVQAGLFVDSSFSASISDALQLPHKDWKSVERFNFGLHSAPHWLKVKLPESTADNPRFLVINYGLLDTVKVWFMSPPEEGSKIIGAHSTGDTREYYRRDINSEKFVFEMPPTAGKSYAYIRVTSKGAINIPVEIWATSDYIEYSSLQKLFLGIFFGYMIAMALSNIYVYATTRNTLFLIYTAYVSSIALLVASLHGIGFHYLWPRSIWLQEFCTPIFACLTMIFVIMLTSNLLELDKKPSIMSRTIRNIKFIFIGLLCLCFVGLPYEVAIKSVLVLLILTTPILFSVGLLLAIRGSIVAKYFCAAWAVLLLSGISISLESFGFYEPPIKSSYLLMIGAITEALLLSLALAVKFNGQLMSAKSTRDTALKNEQEAIEAKEELIKLQEKNQSDLEYSVEERTLELEIALRELSEKNTELEKLSAIDPLTGLMNRRYFDKQIVAECRRSKRELSSLGVAMLDIDFFKKVNDNYGHLGGDYCLQEFANILQKTVKRPADVICRYGGEEFVLILPNTQQDGLTQLLEKVRKNVENEKIMFEGEEISITVSIGACSKIVDSDNDSELMVACADKLLYRAKSSGRNLVMVDTV